MTLSFSSNNQSPARFYIQHYMGHHYMARESLPISSISPWPPQGHIIFNHFLWKIFKLCNGVQIWCQLLLEYCFFLILPPWMFYRLEAAELFSTELLSCCYLERLGNSVPCSHHFRIQCWELCFVLSLVSDDHSVEFVWIVLLISPFWRHSGPPQTPFLINVS